MTRYLNKLDQATHSHSSVLVKMRLRTMVYGRAISVGWMMRGSPCLHCQRSWTSDPVRGRAGLASYYVFVFT